MNFKRIISLLLAIIMCALALASCNLAGIIAGISGSTQSQPDTETTTSTTPDTSSKPDDSGSTNPEEDEWSELYDIITVAEALEIAKGTTTETAERYYICATITELLSAYYGEMKIADETGEIYVYGTYSSDGVFRYSELSERPVVGDVVLLHCTLQNYNGETLQVKNARLIDFIVTPKEDVDISDYTEMTIAEARDAASGAKVKISGVVARITYANGMTPSGLYLVDKTNSIYVYDADLAAVLSIGDDVQIIGTKTYWVLENEQSNANKFGYKGCCQIADASLVETYGENGNVIGNLNEWVEEKSVKDILEIPVTENVTTTVYKTTAFVKKVPGTGFTNYYFYDLDGETGAYTYTQCNGSDFTWLDEFDGKICTVYLSPMNAKSTSSNCYFRFLPVAVVDESFAFDLSKAPEFAIEYYGLGQFLSEYTGNPVLELITNVDSELLGFNGVTLSYTSSNTDVAYIEEVDGKLVFNCANNGTAVITITATYGEYTHSETVEITVNAPVEMDHLTIEEAINTNVGEIIFVEGIVGPSLVNKDGFYLIDENGVLAIIVNDSTVWEGLAIGQKVIVKGTRDKFNSGSNGFGVTCITSATIAVNYYGNHEYPTTSFITDKTLDDFYALDANVDYSTQAFVAKGTVVVEETSYYTNIKLQTPGGKQLTLYCSSASQYNWLKAYAGQEITVEIVPCNWNGKKFWAGCVIAVVTEDGKILNELNFNSN